jgi:hypothetical protein
MMDLEIDLSARQRLLREKVFQALIGLMGENFGAAGMGVIRYLVSTRWQKTQFIPATAMGSCISAR